MKKKYILMLILVSVIVAFDLITKHFCIDWSDYSIIENVVSFDYSINTGASFGMFDGNALLLAILSIVLLIGIISADIVFKQNRVLYNVAVSFIIGGALGNLVDRLSFGYVRDFIRLDFMSFPTFNVADSFLTIGAVLLCIYVLFFTKKADKNNEK